MANIIRILRSITAGNRPPAATTQGEPYINFSDMQFGVYNAAPVDLLAVRFWASTANYVPNDVVLSAGELFVCVTANTNSPPPSVNWTPVVGAATGVDSFNGRTGPVVLTTLDVTTVLPASVTAPLMNGVAVPGIANTWSRGDHVHPTDTSLLPLAGGAMLGQITTLTPIAGTDATNKNYVDNLVGNLQLFLGTWDVGNNTPPITAGGANAGDYYIAITTDPVVPESPPVNLPGISTTDLVGNGDLVLWNGTVWQTVEGSGLTMAEADQLYLSLTGGMMTGALILAGNPAAPLEAATMDYVDNATIDAGTF
jgi:hypothetical protein